MPPYEPGPVAPRDRLDDWVAGAIVVLAMGRVLFILTASMSDVVYRTTDDAYYYFNVARNLVAGHGLTFDGMNPTNGFHPLWMLMLLPLYGLLGEDSEGAIRAVYSLVAVLAGVTLWLAYRAASVFTEHRDAVVATCLLLTPAFANTLLNGLETGVLLLLLFIMLRLLAAPDLARPCSRLHRDAQVGLLLALVLLCRLDSVFLVGAVLCLHIARWAVVNTTRSLVTIGKRAVVAGLPVLLALSAYMMWNLTEFGHATPISGALKSTFPRVSFSLARLAGPQQLFGSLQLVFSFGVLAFLVLSSRASSARGASTRERASRLGVLIAFWTGCMVHFAYSALYMNWAAHWWHYASYVPLTVTAAAVLWGEARSRLGWPALAGAFAVVALISVGLVRYDHLARSVHDHLLAAAIWSRDNLPKEAVIGMTDAGIFGYFSDRATVNLDGVINGYAYQEALRDGRLPEFLRSCGVTHVADYEVRYRNDRFVIPLPARLYHEPGGAIVATEDAEVYRSGTYGVVGEGERRFAIWELDKLNILRSRDTRE